MCDLVLPSVSATKLVALGFLFFMLGHWNQHCVSPELITQVAQGRASATQQNVKTEPSQSRTSSERLHVSAREARISLIVSPKPLALMRRPFSSKLANLSSSSVEFFCQILQIDSLSSAVPFTATRTSPPIREKNPTMDAFLAT